MTEANNVNRLTKEVQNLQNAIHRLDPGSVPQNSSILLNVDQAAKYTKRSRRTFQRELKQGYWTCIRSGGKGHPRFLVKDLDADLEAMKQLGRFRKQLLSD